MAANENVQVRRIIHSGKKRALQTAEIFMDILEPEADIAKRPGLAPMDDVTAFMATINPEDHTMVVGHLPYMERLVSHLVTGTLETPVIKFQNSGIVCLDREKDSKSFFIRWTLFPRLY